MQINQKSATVQLSTAESISSSTLATSTISNENAVSSSIENGAPEELFQTGLSRAGTKSFITSKAEVSSGGLPGSGEPQPNDVPSSATPGNLAFMPSAKTVANASTASLVGQDSFAMACVEALDVNQQSPSAYTAYLNSIQDPSLKSAVSSFVGQNASAAPSTLVDTNGNFSQALLQQAKSYYPSSSGVTSAASTAPAVSTSPAASTASAVSSSSIQNGGPPITMTPTASNIGSWPAIQSNNSALQTYQQWAQVGTVPAVQSAASTVVFDETKLQNDQNALHAANQGLAAAQASSSGTAPDAQGNSQPVSYWQNQQQQAGQTLRNDWQQARNDQAIFWNTLNQATNNGAQGQYQQYVNDPLYTTDGEMPQGFSSAALPSASPQSTAVAPTPNVAVSTTTAAQPSLSASSGIQTLPTLSISSASWPSDAVALLNDANGSKTMSKDDFSKLTDAFSALYAQNPSQYWSTLSQVADPRLAGALNFVVNDKSMYNASSLQSNGASQQQDATQTNNYFNDAAAGKFVNWAPQNEGGASSNVTVSTASQIFTGTDAASQAALKLSEAPAPANQNMSKDDFGNAAVAFASLYKSNPQQYYAALSQISDPKMRDLVNYAVLDTLSNHSDKSSNTQWFSSLFGKYGNTGFTGTTSGLSKNSDGTTLSGAGPLDGTPWKQPS